MAEKKTYRKECEYCKTEYVAQSPLSKTCSDSCRKALSRARKSDSVTNCDSVTVTPEIEQPRVSESDVREMLKTLITLHVESTQQQIKVAEMQEKNIEAQRQNMELQKRTLDFLEQLGLGGFSISQQSAPPAPTYDTKDELPVVEVKKSKAQGGSSQNFLNSIMALNG